MRSVIAVSARPYTSLTVAICTHNHVQRLPLTLKGLAQLVPPRSPWELLIVDNASTDGTPQFLRTAANWQNLKVDVSVVREEKLGVANARNRAIQEASGEYILFMDDDETPDPAWLKTYEQFILTQRPDALGGRIELMFEDTGRPEWLQDELLGFLGRLDHGRLARRLVAPNTPIFTGNSAFRKEIFGRVGAFDIELGRRGIANTGGEDTEIYRRMIASDCNIWWVPDAIIHHRIQAGKLRRSYFLDLHFRQGRTEGMRKRGGSSRMPPPYLVPQLWRAIKNSLSERLSRGSHATLRKDMNVAYFLGYLSGWASSKDRAE